MQGPQTNTKTKDTITLDHNSNCYIASRIDGIDGIDGMGVDEGRGGECISIVVIDVDVILENWPITIVIFNLLVLQQYKTVQYHSNNNIEV